MYEDKVLPCAACQEGFIWTAGEQQFFADKGFTSPPKSCRANRQARKEQRSSGYVNGNIASASGKPNACAYGEGASSSGGYSVPMRRISIPRSVLQVDSGIAMTGTITRLLRDRGFGFIRARDEGEYYFHQQTVDDDFDALAEGMSVSFITESSARGPRAVSVERL